MTGERLTMMGTRSLSDMSLRTSAVPSNAAGVARTFRGHFSVFEDTPPSPSYDYSLPPPETKSTALRPDAGKAFQEEEFEMTQPLFEFEREGGVPDTSRCAPAQQQPVLPKEASAAKTDSDSHARYV